ncbi:MAG: MerC domain-containing protein [Pseudomonadota bacterium]
MPSSLSADRAAIALSLSCIAHCVALPVIAISLPFVAAAAEAEWLHWVLTALAIAASGTVILTARNARAPAFLVPALLGMGLITSALLAETFGLDETLPTVIGGVLLAAAHIYRLFRLR